MQAQVGFNFPLFIVSKEEITHLIDTVVDLQKRHKQVRGN